MRLCQTIWASAPHLNSLSNVVEPPEMQVVSATPDGPRQVARHMLAGSFAGGLERLVPACLQSNAAFGIGRLVLELVAVVIAVSEPRSRRRRSIADIPWLQNTSLHRRAPLCAGSQDEVDGFAARPQSWVP